MAAEVVILSTDEGEVFRVGPFHIVTRVSPAQSQGLFEQYELTLDPSTIDYHIHHKQDETLYVVAGQIEFYVAGKKHLKPAGSVAFVPRGIHHGFTNPGPGKAKVLITFTPAAHQNEYFRELEKLFAAPRLDTAALTALQKRFDQELIPPE